MDIHVLQYDSNIIYRVNCTFFIPLKKIHLHGETALSERTAN